MVAAYLVQAGALRHGIARALLEAGDYRANSSVLVI